jgi:hypothetical protein
VLENFIESPCDGVSRLNNSLGDGATTTMVGTTYVIFEHPMQLPS